MQMLANASKRQQMPANESKQKQLSKQKEEGKKNKKKTCRQASKADVKFGTPWTHYDLICILYNLMRKLLYGYVVLKS